MVSPDFLQLFEATVPILEQDSSLWCISSWNDNAYPHLVRSVCCAVSFVTHVCSVWFCMRAPLLLFIYVRVSAVLLMSCATGMASDPYVPNGIFPRSRLAHQTRDLG